jgi:FixJ family two-component response regulator
MWSPDLGARKLISVIDDDQDVREATTSLIESLGFTVEAFPSAVDFLRSPNVRHTLCLIADVNMPLMTGLELHQSLRELGVTIPTILITAYPDDRIRSLALDQGVVCYLSKPIDQDALLGCVDLALQRRQAGNS